MGLIQTLREIFGNLKRRTPTKKYCPKCGNPNIHLSSKYDVWLMPEKYVCADCGYQGPLALEIEEEPQEPP